MLPVGHLDHRIDVSHSESNSSYHGVHAVFGRNRSRRNKEIQEMSTTFAALHIPRRWSPQQAIFAALLAFALAVGIFGLANYSFADVGVGAAPTDIDLALVDALASNYPPVEHAAAYQAAATTTQATSDQALINALASNYPPVEHAAAYQAAAS